MYVEGDLEVVQRLRRGARFIGTVPDFPYVSHVRHFTSCGEVEARYGKYFNTFSVDEFVDPVGNKKFFMMDGVRR